MGMAASQARYLGLTARKTNCEYEGQQINQARTALANQSANLFNRLLDLEVPVAPKTTDYTEVQYSYSDGTNESVLEEWTQLSSPNPDSNYLVKHYYYTNKFTGSMKQLDDPQVQISNGTVATTNAGIKQAIEELNNAQNALNTSIDNKVTLQNESKNLANYATNKPVYTARAIAGGYEILDASGNVVETFLNYTVASQEQKDSADSVFSNLNELEALPENTDRQNDLFINNNGEIAFRRDLEALHGILPTGGNFALPAYEENNVANKTTQYKGQIAMAEMQEATDRMTYEAALAFYNDLKVPTHVGNCELVNFDPTDKEQLTQVKQIIADMKAQNITAGINECFDENGNYIGGIYSFKMNGQEYFATYEELLASYDSHTGPNDIDGQIKLPYYNTSYIKTKIEETREALLETDSEGRFKSVKFTNDSVVYNLNTETVTDEAAYQDAMNEYNYKVQQYEKTIADINARTSIIQKQDRTLELRLKQLDTEHNALSTELDAVKKVIKDNVEKTFKTFSD